MGETDVREPLYEATLTVSKVTDFGIGLDTLRSDKPDKPDIPEEGLHFHVAFDGSLNGERLNGSLRGVDHVHVRADGGIELHIHAVISTPDGARILLSADGTGTVDDDTGLLHVDQDVVLYSAFADYRWVNGLPIHCVGEVNPDNDEIRITAFER